MRDLPPERKADSTKLYIADLTSLAEPEPIEHCPDHARPPTMRAYRSSRGSVAGLGA